MNAEAVIDNLSLGELQTSVFKAILPSFSSGDLKNKAQKIKIFLGIIDVSDYSEIINKAERFLASGDYFRALQAIAPLKFQNRTDKQNDALFDYVWAKNDENEYLTNDELFFFDIYVNYLGAHASVGTGDMETAEVNLIFSIQQIKERFTDFESLDKNNPINSILSCLHLPLAYISYQIMDYSQSIEKCDFIISREYYNDPAEEVQYYTIRGLSYYRLDKHLESVADLTHALKIDPRIIEICEFISLSYWDTKQINEVIKYSTIGIEAGYKGSLYFVRGKAYQNQDEPHKAIADFKIAAEIEPDGIDIYQAHAQCLIEIGDFRQAIAILNIIMEKKYIDNVIEYDDRKPDTVLLDEKSIIARLKELLENEDISESAKEAISANFWRELYIAKASARTKWADRKKDDALSSLTAPEFLKIIHANDIKNGQVDSDFIRAVDKDLMDAVDAYVSQRAARNTGPGRAAGLTIIASRPARNRRKEGDDLAP